MQAREPPALLKGVCNWCGCQEQSCPHSPSPGTGVKRSLIVILSTDQTAHRASLSMTRSSQSLWRTVGESTSRVSR